VSVLKYPARWLPSIVHWAYYPGDPCPHRKCHHRAAHGEESG
jgi:hypothetical protein